MGSFLRDRWRPNTILWTDASVSQDCHRGGTAVVRFCDGAVLHSERHRGKRLSSLSLERYAIGMALRLARHIVAAGGGPVEIRYDCRQAGSGFTLRRGEDTNIRLVLGYRGDNLAHDPANRVRTTSAPPHTLLASGVEQLRSSPAS